ncbi:hypothetical protein BaRGS_00018202 [Batillaria attramentaria]|uniref:Uncharacterized protein n=1 Tax=Batillaria attramentaria TaxID=370345 RepID=A0ABD0KUM7_9CAEN
MNIETFETHTARTCVSLDPKEAETPETYRIQYANGTRVRDCLAEHPRHWKPKTIPSINNRSLPSSPIISVPGKSLNEQTGKHSQGESRITSLAKTHKLRPCARRYVPRKKWTINHGILRMRCIIHMFINPEGAASTADRVIFVQEMVAKDLHSLACILLLVAVPMGLLCIFGESD